MKKAILNTLVLVSICAVMTGLLAVTNYFTSDIISARQSLADKAALEEVMPNGEFVPVDISNMKMPSTVEAVYKETGGQGYAIKLVTAGKNSGFNIMCAVDQNGKVIKSITVSHNETKEKYYDVVFPAFGEKFANLTVEEANDVDAKNGATLSSQAYKDAIIDALKAAALLRGEDVDTRTPEEVLADNLNAALPAGEGKFTKPFIAEVLEGIDAVYKADNGRGYVFVIGEEFIPVDENGNTDNETVKTAYDILAASSETAIDLTAYGDALKYITSAKKTATGNYIVEAKGNGYGIMGEYHASGEYIIVRVSITPDGKIIDTYTVSQSESVNVGDACAKEDFYGQFDGKTESDYKDIDAITGATVTTDGYLKAIERAFAAVKILEGGSN